MTFRYFFVKHVQNYGFLHSFMKGKNIKNIQTLAWFFWPFPTQLWKLCTEKSISHQNRTFQTQFTLHFNWPPLHSAAQNLLQNNNKFTYLQKSKQFLGKNILFSVSLSNFLYSFLFYYFQLAILNTTFSFSIDR